MNKNIGADALRTETPVQLVPFPALAGTVTQARSPNRPWLIGGAITLVVLAGAATAWWLSRSSATVRYTTASVTRGDVTDTVTATGCG